MTNRYIFLDDFRLPKDAYNYLLQPIYISVDWEIVRNYDEFVKIIIEKGIPEIISFDHDLSIDDIENWKDVVGYEGIYQVSTLGRVMRIKKCKGTSGNNILTPNKRINGLTVTLRNKGNDRHIAIHIIECETFYGINPNKRYVNHDDGNRWNI